MRASTICDYLDGMLLLALLLAADFNEKNGLMYARIWKEKTIGAGLSHDHVLVPKKWSGTITYSPEACDIKLSFAVADIEPDEDAMRKRFGLDGVIDAGDRKKIKANMLDKDQLNGTQFKTITFAANKCHGRGAMSGVMDVEGDVTIRGKAKHVRFPVSFDWSDKGLKMKGSFVVQHADFGFEPYSAALGIVKNGPDIEIGMELAPAG